MNKQRITKNGRAVKPERIRKEHQALREQQKHILIDDDRFPTMKRGSETERTWSKIHTDAFRPGAPPNGLKFTNNAHLAYLQLLSLLHGHRVWIPKTPRVQEHFGLTARQTRERLCLLADLKLISVVPIEEVDANYYACKQAIVILNLPAWYSNHGQFDQAAQDKIHFEDVAKRRAKKKKPKLSGLRLVKSVVRLADNDA